MENAAKQTTSEEIPAYACTAARLASLFGGTESAIHLYADEGLLPRLPHDRYDCVWLLNLAIGQKIIAGTQAALSVKATVTLGWIESMGDNLDSSEDRDAFIAVFERNGLTRDDFYAAIDEALAFCDAQASPH
jgi:hypothetical protein